MLRKPKNQIVRLLVSSDQFDHNYADVRKHLIEQQFISDKNQLVKELYNNPIINRNKLLQIFNEDVNPIIKGIMTYQQFESYVNKHDISINAYQINNNVYQQTCYSDISGHNVSANWAIKKVTDVTYDMEPIYSYNRFNIRKEEIIYTLQKWFYSVYNLVPFKEPELPKEKIEQIYNNWLGIDYHFNLDTFEPITSFQTNNQVLDFLCKNNQKSYTLYIFGNNIFTNKVQETDFVMNRLPNQYDSTRLCYIFTIIDQFEFGPDQSRINHPELRYFISSDLMTNKFDNSEQMNNYSSIADAAFPPYKNGFYCIDYSHFFIKPYLKEFPNNILFMSTLLEDEMTYKRAYSQRGKK